MQNVKCRSIVHSTFYSAGFPKKNNLPLQAKQNGNDIPGDKNMTGTNTFGSLTSSATNKWHFS